MNKLIAKLSAGESVIRNQRAQIVAEDIQSEIESMIVTLEKKKREITKVKLNHTDIGPNETTSLRVVDESFNACNWVDDLLRIEKDLLNIEIELEIANRIKREWLVDDQSGNVQENG